MARLAADVIEDLEFLDDTATGATAAAERTGFPSAEAMEKWLERNKRPDLWLRMKARDPQGMHHRTKEKRAMSVVPTPIDTLSTLLADAAKSTRTRTRNKAERIASMVDELRATLAAERDDDARRETARKEVERLERQLAEAKARLRGGSVTIDVGDGVSAADLRAWAKRNGIDCPAMGRVPAAVREAYEADDDVAS